MILKIGEKYKLKRDIFILQNGEFLKYARKGEILEYSRKGRNSELCRFISILGNIGYLRLESIEDDLEPLNNIKVGHSHRKTAIFL